MRGARLLLGGSAAASRHQPRRVATHTPPLNLVSVATGDEETRTEVEEDVDDEEHVDEELPPAHEARAAAGVVTGGCLGSWCVPGLMLQGMPRAVRVCVRVDAPRYAQGGAGVCQG